MAHTVPQIGSAVKRGGAKRRNLDGDGRYHDAPKRNFRHTGHGHGSAQLTWEIPPGRRAPRTGWHESCIGGEAEGQTSRPRTGLRVAVARVSKGCGAPL